jgi:hypothetical protein
MNDKSPRQQSSKKSGKTLKEKRAEKQAKRAGAASPIPPTEKPRRG